MFEQLLTSGILKLAGGVFVVMSTVRHVFAEPFQTKVGQRLIPVVPLGLGIGGAFLGVAEAATLGDKIMAGLVAGFAASHFFKIGRTTVLGWGVEVPTPEDVQAPAPAPVPDPSKPSNP